MIYRIVKYGDPVLERPAEQVREFDTPELRRLVEDMFESMYAAQGVGLAAPQIGISRRIAVIDPSAGEDPSRRIVLINPEIVAIEGVQ
ncbi:MAG: peptide deformylase, partial [Anaerolineae bacterium]|nr:peptide deformylase [Anaerolineae bacterium]